MGGWNLPPYGSNASYALPGANAQMGSYPTYYTPSMYLSSSMSVPSNTFSMQVLKYPQVFHMGRINFIVRATLFMGPLHKGATYIIT
jgi:hypothetical protein